MRSLIKIPKNKSQHPPVKNKKSSVNQTKKPINDILNLHKVVGNQAVQNMFESGAIPGNYNVGIKEKSSSQDKIAPEVVELKNMATFKPQPAVDRWFDEQDGSRGKIKVRYGKIAEGIIHVQKSKDQYKIQKQAIPLKHPIFKKLGGTSASLSPSLIVQAGKNSAIKGFIGLSASIKSNKSIGKYLQRSPEIIGLTGFNVNKIHNITNKLENGQLTMAVTNIPISFAKVLSGTFSIAMIDESIQTFEGNLNVSVKGLEKGELNVKRSPEGKIIGKGEIGLQLPKNFSGNIIVEWDGTAFGGEGKVGYAGEKLSGSITLNVMEKSRANQLENENKAPQKKAAPTFKKGKVNNEKYVVFGQGDLTFAFNEWLNGNAQVVVDPKGHVTIIGEITPQKEFELFPQKDYNKKLFKVEARASYGLPVVGNIFIFANIGLFAFAKVGPAKFYKIKVAGTYSTDPKKRQDFTIQGSLNVSAAAGLKLRGEAGAGLEILAHDIKAGAGINALAGIRGYAEATPVIGYREKAKEGEDKKGEFFIKGDLEIAAQPFLGLGGDLFVEVDSPWWSPLGDKKWTWPLGNKEWPMGGSFGINASIDHVFGSKQFPSVEFKKVDFSADKFLTDLYSDKTKSKSGDKGEQQGQWKEKNTKAAEPSGKAQKGNLEEGKAPKLPPAKSKVKPGGAKKATKPIDPNAKTAEGKSVKQLQKETTQKGKKTDIKTSQKGIVKETSKETPKQIHDKELEKGLEALDAVTNRYAKDGATSKEMKTGVKAVRRKFKVFKSISVIEKNGYWYYEYVASSPQPQKGPKAKGDINKIEHENFYGEMILRVTTDTFYLVRAGGEGSHICGAYGDHIFDNKNKAIKYARAIVIKGKKTIRNDSGLPVKWPPNNQGKIEEGNPVEIFYVLKGKGRYMYVQGVVAPQPETGKIFVTPKIILNLEGTLKNLRDTESKIKKLEISGTKQELKIAKQNLKRWKEKYKECSKTLSGGGPQVQVLAKPNYTIIAQFDIV